MTYSLHLAEWRLTIPVGRASSQQAHAYRPFSPPLFETDTPSSRDTTNQSSHCAKTSPDLFWSRGLVFPEVSDANHEWHQKERSKWGQRHGASGTEQRQRARRSPVKSCRAAAVCELADEAQALYVYQGTFNIGSNQARRYSQREGSQRYLQSAPPPPSLFLLNILTSLTPRVSSSKICTKYPRSMTSSRGLDGLERRDAITLDVLLHVFPTRCP